ncbi:MAG: ATP-dependent Clp protease ATP-binding subunit [bacterium]
MDQIISKFNNHLKNVLTRALCLVVEQKGDKIEPTHLLWALGTEEGSVAAEILNKAGAEKTKLDQLVGTTNEPEQASEQTPQNAIPALSDQSKLAIEKAVLTANMFEHRYIGTEHLLSGIMQIGISDIMQFLDESRIDVQLLNKSLATILQSTASFPDLFDRQLVAPQAFPDMDLMSPDFGNDPVEDASKSPALDYFTEELTAMDAVESVNPVIGRDLEISRMMKVLSRKTKNNPILVGEPGVGKTAIVEGLAERIVKGEVADTLLDKRIFKVDLAGMVAGTMYRGEFESRLRQLIEEVTARPEIILFVDEAHTMVGAGSSSGSLDAANILKPALARGDIRCIGATTPAEFKKTIETDGALERRFQPIKVAEPTAKQTREILFGIRNFYEEHHRVRFTDEALDAAVELSERYLTGRNFPDKAIDLLDEAGAAANVRRRSSKHKADLAQARAHLRNAREEKRKAVLNEQFGEASKLKEREEKLEQRINQFQNSGRKSPYVKVCVHEMISAVSEMTGIPTKTLSVTEQRKLKNLEADLEKFIKGQNDVICRVARTVRKAKLGITQTERPLASFMFVGPSGVGKTELAKTLSKTLFDDAESFLRLDMSEFAEGFSVSKLIGAPAGYVGYREATKLTDHVKNHPYSVVLFDELEKAHADVQNLLLQILDDGMLTDSTGRKINFRHAIIIMCTNVGHERFERGGVGFRDNDNGHNNDRNSDIRELLEERFRREIINRIDHVCIFEPLSNVALEEIAKKELTELKDRLQSQEIDLLFTNAVLKNIVSKISPKLGAREIRKIIEEQVEQQIAEAMLGSEDVEKSFKLGAKNGKIVIEQ